MTEKINYLIGSGERLMQGIDLRPGGGAKAHPYTIEEAIRRLTPKTVALGEALADLPELACPNGEAVVAMTLHPSYLAKSYHPTSFLSSLGLRQVGSRERKIVPEKSTRKASDDPVMTAELFVAGKRDRLANLREVLIQGDEALLNEFRQFEDLRPLGAERLRTVRGDEPRPPLEVVLHADMTKDWGERILLGFAAWCRSFGILDDFRQQEAGGLTFLGLRADRECHSKLLEFAFVRRVRRMPKLAFRDMPTRARRSTTVFPVTLANQSPADPDLKVAIFDGGLPDDHPFPACVRPREAPGVSGTVAQALEHGVHVTSALLYGSLSQAHVPEQPFAGVDHWRVLDDVDDNFELMTTLDRVMDVLEQHPYEVVSLSIGPDEAMLDDDVHVWTSRLDQFAAEGGTLIVSAAGNNGRLNQAHGLCRVQPAADGVNVLAVGAADRTGDGWARAPYSACGPGRSPGFVKPDVLAFGGSDSHRFFVAEPGDQARGVSGTSFAAPAAARLGVGLRALFGSQITPVGIKALLVHGGRDSPHAQREVGWGCLPDQLGDLATCHNGEATIVYQGILEPSRYRRFILPLPQGLTGRVEMLATFVVATDVNPEDAVNYTRSGVGITFRPKTVGPMGMTKRPDGEMVERQVHPSGDFFARAKLYDTEQTLRNDAHRWEAVLRRKRRFNSSTLDQPAFDIEHLARDHGQPSVRPDAVRYALVVTIRNPATPNLYDRVLQAFAGRLQAMRPQIDISIQLET